LAGPWYGWSIKNPDEGIKGGGRGSEHTYRVLLLIKQPTWRAKKVKSGQSGFYFRKQLQSTGRTGKIIGTFAVILVAQRGQVAHRVPYETQALVQGHTPNTKMNLR